MATAARTKLLCTWYKLRAQADLTTNMHVVDGWLRLLVVCLYVMFILHFHLIRMHRTLAEWHQALHINLICDKTFVRPNLVAHKCIVIAAIISATVANIGPIHWCTVHVVADATSASPTLGKCAVLGKNLTF